MFNVLFVLWVIGIWRVNCCLTPLKQEVKIEVSQSEIWNLEIIKAVPNSIEIIAEHEDILSVSTTINESNAAIIVNITSMAAGKSEVSAICETDMNKTEQQFLLHIQVHRSKMLDLISLGFGWSYFISWSVCFYPQIYDNYKRQSVVGLNFDGILFCFVGYFLYNTFNIAMMYVPLIKMQYSQRYPKGILPVIPNDLVFSMHSVFASIVTGIQCMIYYREKQKVSRSAIITIVLLFLVLGACSVLALLDVMLWLDVMYICSYIKMYGSVMSYLPQAYMNYKRQSTSGYSISGIIIDILGSIFCTLQMFLDGYNYDDWKTIFENPTKFGLSVVTIAATSIFIVQHYFLYRKQPDQKLELQQV